MDSLQVLILSGCLKMDNLTRVSGTTGFPSFISSLTNLQVLEIGRYQQTESPTWWTPIFQKQPQSLVLPSLASLQLLTELKVINCNISEVCRDIGALSCLKRLEFTNLPGSLSQLSRLEFLVLNGCKKLEVLPELPPSIWFLDASQCTSLQQPPGLIHRRHHLHFDFIDCPKMFGNVTIDSRVSMSISKTRLIDSSTTSHASTNQVSFLVEYLGIQSRKILEFFSGSRIPRWFTNKSKGSHVKVELPPNWCYSKFKGYAFCVVFTLKESWRLGKPGCSVNNFDGASIDGVDACYWEWDVQTFHRDWDEAKNFVTFSFGDINEDTGEDIFEVKEYGVRLVCDDDEDLKEEKTVLSMIKHLPPQTQPTGGYFWLFDDVDCISIAC